MGVEIIDISISLDSVKIIDSLEILDSFEILDSLEIFDSQDGHIITSRLHLIPKKW